ncbi:MULTISPECIES: hypothetical protein [Rhizobium/Agrobacterium group]|nr:MULTISPECIES: hypothetical protein [Rhizobium/Agrobacterium group]MUO45699.1 hypothetical protein [Agrobacterium vitis]MVA49017.1 hypothetical protein [Agrobacterium vitis]
MATTTQFNPLRLVNDAINNANMAGQTLTTDAIALLWKVAQGKLSKGDAAELSRTLIGTIIQKRERHEVRVVDKETAAALDAKQRPCPKYADNSSRYKLQRPIIAPPSSNSRSDVVRGHRFKTYLDHGLNTSRLTEGPGAFGSPSCGYANPAFIRVAAIRLAALGQWIANHAFGYTNPLALAIGQLLNAAPFS